MKVVTINLGKDLSSGSLFLLFLAFPSWSIETKASLCAVTFVYVRSDTVLFFFQCSYLPCSPHTTCINLQPGYKCTACPKGFLGNSTMGIGRGFAENIKQVKDK